jgi:heme oxygenase
MLKEEKHVILQESLPKNIRDSHTASAVLTALRAATKSRHSILDTSMPLAKLDATWADYISHLQLLATWLVPLERWLAQYEDGPQASDILEPVRYGDLILNDLGQDNYPLDFAHSTLPSWPRNSDAAYRWGIAYVVEGSQLGGEFLYKRLADRFKPHELHYLQSKQPGRWPRFLHAIAIGVITKEEITSACTGAVDAFDALLQLQ